MMGAHPEAFEIWLQEAKTDEKFAFLWELLEQLQKSNQVLTQENKQLTAQVQNLKQMLNAHKHAGTTGEAVLPAGLVNL